MTTDNLDTTIPHSKTIPQSNKAKVGTPIAFDLLADYRSLPPTPCNVLKATRAAMVWKSRSPLGRVAVLVRYAEWITKVPVQALLCLRRWGGKARKEGAGSVASQFLQMMRLALRYLIEPKDYHRTALFRVSQASNFNSLVPYALYSSVASRLSLISDPELHCTISDKRCFRSLMNAKALPSPPILAYVPRSGNVPEVIPQTDLIVKPVHGCQGRGITGFRWADDGYFDVNGRRFEGDAFREHLRVLALQSEAGLLLQPRLLNHPSLSAFGGTALATTRVCTIQNEKGEPEVVEAFLRISTRPGAVVDNFHAGGLLYPVDLRSGKLITTVTSNAMTDEIPSLAPGTKHPLFEEVRELALLCHNAFPTLFIVGWDIAVTTDGPVVIEANIPPGITIARQLATGGLAGSRLIGLLAWHAHEWLAANVSNGSRWRIGSTYHEGQPPFED